MGFVVNPVTARRGLRAAFMKAFDNAENPADVMPFIMETQSDGDDEEYGWLGQSPSMSEWTDERQIKALNEFEYRIPNKDYEGTLGVDRNALKDDRMGAVKIRIDDLARKARIHPRKLFYEALVAGTTELCYDGQPFFSASHVEGASGTQSNLLTGSGTSLAQLKTDVIAAEVAMLSYKDDTGEPFNEGEVTLGVVCPVALKQNFLELNTLAEISSSTNAMRGRFSTIVSSSRLSDANDWYLADVSAGLKPFIKQDRQAPEFNSLEGDSDAGFMKKKWYYGIDYRVGFGYGMWQKMVKTTNA